MQMPHPPPGVPGADSGGFAASIAPMQSTRRTFLRCGCGLPLWAGMAALTGCASTAGPSSTTNAEARRLHDVFARHWEALAKLAPEWGTFRGDHRYGGELAQVGPQAQATRRRLLEGFLAEARAISAQALDARDRTSREMFILNLQTQLDLDRFEGYRSMNLGALRGPHTLMSGLLQQQPVDTPEQREQVLARLAQHPRRIDQEIEQLLRAQQLGWVSAKPVLQRVLAQLDGQIKADIAKGPFMDPWRRLPTSVGQAEAATWRARGEAAVRRDVIPALQKLREVVAQRLLPAAPEAGGLLRYPDGEAVYAALVKQNTTTNRSPREIHQMGLEQLALLHEEFAKLRERMGLKMGFSEAVKALSTPEHYFSSPQTMLEGYRAVAKQLDPWMPRLFTELPRSSYGIRPMAEHLGPGAADNYTGPPLDGSGPGWYNANVLAYQRRQKWALPSLVAHETVPGHHLQVARARELGDLPAFRRGGGYTAFSEGWALYAERLMDEVGFYETPQDRWGYLQAQAFRAARLVVDTGLHALGWSRQQAIDTMNDRVGENPIFMTAEVDRYISTPAQALAYMTGQLHILDERTKARQALGSKFDLRRFNNAVIDNGAVPLDVLSRLLGEWAKTQQG